MQIFCCIRKREIFYFDRSLFVTLVVYQYMYIDLWVNNFFLLFLQQEDVQQQIVRETFQLVSKRDDNVCNFLEGGTYVSQKQKFKSMFHKPLFLHY